MLRRSAAYYLGAFIMAKRVSEKTMKFIAQRLRDVADTKPNFNSESVDPQKDFEKYQDLALLLIEPDIHAEGPDFDSKTNEFYMDWIQNDTDNWAQYINNLLGDEWGRIAKFVSTHGY